MEEDIKQKEKRGYVDPAFWNYKIKLELGLLLFSIQSIRDKKPKIAMVINYN